MGAVSCPSDPTTRAGRGKGRRGRGELRGREEREERGDRLGYDPAGRGVGGCGAEEGVEAGGGAVQRRGGAVEARLGPPVERLPCAGTRAVSADRSPTGLAVAKGTGLRGAGCAGRGVGGVCGGAGRAGPRGRPGDEWDWRDQAPPSGPAIGPRHRAPPSGPAIDTRRGTPCACRRERRGVRDGQRARRGGGPARAGKGGE